MSRIQLSAMAKSQHFGQALDRTATGLRLQQMEAEARITRAMQAVGQHVEKSMAQLVNRRCICCGALWYEVEHD